MVRRPPSLPHARSVMEAALADLNGSGRVTPCAGKPARYADMRQTPEDAAKLCSGCPLLFECRDLGFTESVYADDMVYGGLVFRRGKPVDATSKNRQRGPKFR